MASAANMNCTICDKPMAKLCAKCRWTRFCSAECHEVARPLHNLICADFSAFSNANRPSADYFRAIFFPVERSKPEFVWLHCPRAKDTELRKQFPSNTKLREPNVQQFVGADITIRSKALQQDPLSRIDLNNTIYICSRAAFLEDGSERNNSIEAVSAIISKKHYDWRGPVIAYGKKDDGEDQDECDDLDVKDFRTIANYFLHYDAKHVTEDLGGPAGKVQAVRINCEGEMAALGNPQFQAIEIDSDHSIFTVHDTSDIAQRVGVPIYMRKSLVDSVGTIRDAAYAFEFGISLHNAPAESLQLCCNLEAQRHFYPTVQNTNLGRAPPKWTTDVGSVIVARQDMKPLLPLHLEILCDYCQNTLAPIFDIARSQLEEPESRRTPDALRMICRPGFIAAWFAYLTKKRDEGADLDVDMPLPEYGEALAGTG